RIGPDRTAPADAAVVLDTPYALPLLAGRPVVPVGDSPAAVAELLDIERASDLISGARVTSKPDGVRPWTDIPGVGLAAARCGGGVPDAQVGTHHGLRVNGTAVPWWPDGATDHVDAAAGAPALGRALAWRLGAWSHRAGAVEALTAPSEADRLAAEDAAHS
ncbi:MAG: hypothetical protein ACR2F6_02980, partial [Mycobacteriales bacterium]